MSKSQFKFTDAVVIDGIIVLLGLTVLTQFYTLLASGAFTSAGFSAKITDIANYAGTLKPLLSALLPYHTILAPVCACITLITAICLILLIARAWVATMTGIVYLLQWVILWRYPGVWTFEFLFPALFGICAGFAKLGHSTFATSFYRQLGWSKRKSIITVLLVSALLWYVTDIAYVDKILAFKIALDSSVTFMLISLLHLSVDSKLQPLVSTENNDKIATLWIDIMIIIIGAMMVMQVYADYFTGLYTLKGYAGLVEYYSIASGAIWSHPFLAWSAVHTPILLPLQVIFEIAIAGLLTLLIFRGPVLLLAAGLFGILAFSELGVSADWPPNPHNLTWEWELLLVTGVSLLIGYNKLIAMINANNIQEAILGNKLFNCISFGKCLLIAISGGIGLYFIGMMTQIFGDPYKIISLCSALTFLVLLLLLGVKDRISRENTQKTDRELLNEKAA